MVIKILSFGMSSPLFKEVMKVRKTVFVDELGMDPEFDFDGLDDKAVHFLLTVNDKPVGSARWVETDQGIKIERLATIPEYRGQGLGQLLLRQVVFDVLPSKKRIYLHSPELLVEFFRWNGFEVEGEKFEEAGVPHYKMVYTKQQHKGSEISNFFKGLFKRTKKYY